MAENAREMEEGEGRDGCGRVNNFRIVARNRGRQNMENTPLCGIGAKGHIDGRRQGGGHMDGRTAAGARTRGERGQGQRLQTCVYVYLVSGYWKTCQLFLPSFPLLPLFPPPSPCQLQTMTADIEKPHRRFLYSSAISALDIYGKAFPYVEKCKPLQWRV